MSQGKESGLSKNNLVTRDRSCFPEAGRNGPYFCDVGESRDDGAQVKPIESSSKSPLALRWFGESEVFVQGNPLPPLRHRKALWLLAYLTLRHDRAVARQEVAALFWPDAEESQALYYLRRLLTQLRSALGSEASRLLTPSPHTLQLDLSGADCDVLSFDTTLARIGVSAQPEESLQKAISLHRGPLLPDCLEDWAIAERNAREQSYLGALERLVRLTREKGEAIAVVRWLRLLLTADPYRESAVRELMQTLADSGDHAALQQVYQEFRSRLRENLNVAPAPETEALYRSFGSLSTKPVSLPPASAAAAGTLRHLPIPLSDLIGREQEVEEVCGWLSKSRLVTLVGVGGVGKTRLAIAAADRVMERFTDGVWFADLAPLNAPSQITLTLLRLFGLKGEPQTPVEESLKQELSSRMLLLILDNCEHLLEECAFLVDQMLSACPGLRILATTREALGLAGEYIYTVPSLSLPPVGQRVVEKEASTLLEYGAVRLLVERARQANASFQLTLGNADAVAQICHRLDGIPLALELAAARVRALTAAQIAARLDDRFRLLTGGSRAVLPRQRTLQTAIDWSYDHLSEEERILFHRVSLFAGDWSLEAAEAICADKLIAEADVLDLLTHLVQKSLVVFDGAEGKARYSMLESLRQYSAERLAESGERETLRGQYCHFFLHWAEAAEPHFYGPEQSAWYDHVEKEYSNLRAALKWCQGEKALRLVGALSAFWDVRGYHKEGLAHQMTALSLAGMAGTPARTKVLLAAGQLSIRQGDLTLATTLLEECLTLRRKLGDTLGVGRVLNDLAEVALLQGNLRQARTCSEESLRMAREQGDRPSAIGALYMMGQISLFEGDTALAVSFYEECLVMQRELGDTRGIAGSLRSLGNAVWKQNNPTLARSLYEESLAIDRVLGDKAGILYTLHRLGHIAQAVGDYGRASSYYKERLALLWELDDVNAIILSLEDFASLTVCQEQYEDAARLLGAMKTLYQTRGSNTPGAESAEYTRMLDIIRASLGEESFAVAWAKGGAMTLEQSILFARS